MPESAAEWYARVMRDLPGHAVEDDIRDWGPWPYRADWTVKDLEPPTEETPRRGAGGEDCFSCRAGADPAAAQAIWWDDLFFVRAEEGSSLPFAQLLMPRRHADLADLTPDEARRQGEIMTALEQAAVETLDVPRIQAARWGDGGEHLHWWFYARPTGAMQLRGSFLMLWDGLLPPRDPADARADQLLVAAALARRIGGHVASS